MPEPSRADLWARFAAGVVSDCGTSSGTAAEVADALLAEFDKRWVLADGEAAIQTN